MTFSFVFAQESNGQGEDHPFLSPESSASIVRHGVDFVPGVVLVQMDAAIEDSAQTRSIAMAALPGVHAVSPLSHLPQTYEVAVEPGNETAIAAELQNHPGVRVAEPDYHFYKTATTPNDSLFERYQWNLRHIGADQGWDRTKGSNNTIIAILDSGVDLSHPDLVDKIVPGYDTVNSDADPSDDEGHGTHVASIAAADSNNEQGIAGVAWGARIMPVKVLDATGSGRSSSLAEGIIWAVDHGADVINMSLGGSNFSVVVAEAIDYANTRGVLVVAAAGNHYQNGNPTVYPAAYNHVLAVAATNDGDGHASYSSSGSYIDVAAPGGDPSSNTDSDIRHWIPGAYWRGAGSSGYAWLSGTSQAAPHVAGLAALLLSLNPDLSPNQLTSTIMGTALDIQSPGWDEFSGYGRIDVMAALNTIQSVVANTATIVPTPIHTATPTHTPTPSSTPTPTAPSRPREDTRINASALGNQTDAAIVTDPTGNFTTLWRDGGNDNDSVYSASLSARGSAWGVNVPVVGTQQATNADALGAPFTAVDASGNVHAVWHGRTMNGDSDIYYAFLGSGKSQWHTPIPISVDAELPANQTNPVLTVADDGTLIVLWEDDRNGLADGSRSQIYWSERRQNTAVWRTPTTVNADTGDQSEATLALGGGRLYAVWISRDESAALKMASKTLADPAWSAPATLAMLDATVDHYDPDIVVDEGGTITIVWADRQMLANGIDVFAIQKTAEASGWSPVVRVNDDSTAANQRHPRLASGTKGLALVWEDNRQGDFDIFVAWQTPNTATWSTDVRVNQDTSGFLQSSPDVAIDAAGNTAIVWTDSRTGSTAPDIYSRFIPVDARFQVYLSKVEK